MSVMAPTKPRGRRGRYTRARRNDRPAKCGNCRREIVWAVVQDPEGALRRRDDGRLALIPLNADPVPNGRYEYLRGSIGRPVVRELDDVQRLAPSDTTRYARHLDVPAAER